MPHACGHFEIFQDELYAICFVYNYSVSGRLDSNMVCYDKIDICLRNCGKGVCESTHARAHACARVHSMWIKADILNAWIKVNGSLVSISFLLSEICQTT